MELESCDRILVWVQYVRGIGHLRRASALVESIIAQNNDVSIAFVSGGPEIKPLRDHLEGLSHRLQFVQLLPVYIADQESWELVNTENKKQSKKEWRKRRKSLLLEVLSAFQPDCVITEMFPFGRHGFRHELDAMLSYCYECSPRPVILSSIRDILVQDRDNLHQWSANIINKYYDAVLVHADEQLIPFEQTFTHFGEIKDKIRYTGYICQSHNDASSSSSSSTSHDEILISTGGGGTGDPESLYRLSAQARLLVPEWIRKLNWRLLVGWCINDETFCQLRQELEKVPDPDTGGQIIVERARPDFSQLLSQCYVSVSQGGYNTVMETLNVKACAVILPYSSAADVEQVLRAEALASKGLVQVIKSQDLTAASLAEAISHVASQKHQRKVHEEDNTIHDHQHRDRKTTHDDKNPREGIENSLFIQLDGGQKSASIILDLLRQRKLDSTSRHPRPLAISKQKGTRDVKTPSRGGLPPPSSSASASTCPSITVVLLHYKRKENILRILDCLTTQTAQPQIFLWNNSGNEFVDDRIDWQIDSSENKFCWPRWFMASLAKTKYVCTMDDDIIFKDNHVLQDMIGFLERDYQKLLEKTKTRIPESNNFDNAMKQDIEAGPPSCRIAGLAGCILHPSPTISYADGFHVTADSFPWSHAKEVPWQDPICFEQNRQEKDSKDGLDLKAAGTGSDTDELEGRWKSRSWNYHPPWLPRLHTNDRRNHFPWPSSSSSSIPSTSSPSTSSSAQQISNQELEATSLAVDIVKGRLMMTQRQALTNNLALKFTHQDIRGDDIALSGLLTPAGEARYHRVLRLLNGRVLELPAPFALCDDQSLHYERRDQVKQRFFPGRNQTI